MLFESTTVLLRTIVNALQTGDEAKWDDTLQSGNQSLYELHQMSRPASRVARGDGKSKFPTTALPTERAIRAIPHVKVMMSAIRSRDQEKAVREGCAAISAMNGNIPVQPPNLPSPPTAPEVTVVAVKRPAKAHVIAKKRPAPANRKPARVLVAGSK